MAITNLAPRPDNARPLGSNKEVSGPKWARQFIGGTHIYDLTGTFRHGGGRDVPHWSNNGR